MPTPTASNVVVVNGLTPYKVNIPITVLTEKSDFSSSTKREVSTAYETTSMVSTSNGFPIGGLSDSWTFLPYGSTKSEIETALLSTTTTAPTIITTTTSRFLSSITTITTTTITKSFIKTTTHRSYTSPKPTTEPIAPWIWDWSLI